MEKIIDVSVHNGTIDFNKVKEAGIKKVIIRLGWIGNKNNHTLDSKFIENYNKAIYAGFQIGVYVYSYCKSVEAIKSGTNWVISKLNLFSSNKPQLPVFLDLEDSTIAGLSRQELTNHGIEFCKKIEENGFTAGVYANKNWFTTKLYVNQLLNYKIWLAQYANIDKPNVDFKVDLWQYTSNGRVNGIFGRVDMNYCLLCEQKTQEEITGKKEETSQNKSNGGGFEVKTYQNGSTKEIVYQDLNCTKKIGYLNPRETAECYGIISNKALVVYNVDKTNNKKTGFVKWLGGVK